MNKKNDGGPAYPRPASLRADGHQANPEQPGMSLRDYVAKGIFEQLIAADIAHATGVSMQDSAKRSFEAADAWLEAREKEE